MQTLNQEIQEFSIQGMSCAGCAARIERSLAQSAGVEKVVVNFAAHSAVVKSALEPSEIEKRIEQLGYQAAWVKPGFSFEENFKREKADAVRRLKLAILLGLPVITLGMIHSLSAQTWVRVVEAVLTAALLSGPGSLFFRKAFSLLKQRSANMDTLVSLGASITFLWSCIQTWQGAEGIYFETAAAIVVFVLVGKFIEQQMTWKATSSLGHLLQLQPPTAQRVVHDGSADVETLDLRFVRTGDTLLTRVGERFAADGVVLSGCTEVDESLLTGESLPVVKSVGDTVVAGSLNKIAPVTYTVQAVGGHSRLGEIVKFVERTQLSKAPIQRLADRVSAVFVPVIVVLSTLTFLVWTFVLGGAFSDSINAAVSVLVVACPCALGLATPIAVMIATGKAARRGILFRDLAALEALQSIRTVVFDKTGTLTNGQLSVSSEVWMCKDEHLPVERNRILSLVAQLEQNSQHPVAVAVVGYVRGTQTQPLHSMSLTDVREVVGEGMYAVWPGPHGNSTVRVGRPLGGHGLHLPERPGESWVICSMDERPVLAWSLVDSLRSDAAAVIAKLKSMNVKSVLASGDHAHVVKSVGDTLGIEHHAQLSPQMKAELVAQLKARGDSVAMLGDGVNDAPALALADIGIAMGSGSDAAQQTAALTLKDTNLAGLLAALQLSHVTFANIRQNLAWAFGYNIVLIPLAMMGRLTPMWAAGAMVLSSLFVVLNSLRITAVRLK